MPVRLKIQLVSVAEDGSESAADLLVLTKQHERLEQIGVETIAGDLLDRGNDGLARVSWRKSHPAIDAPDRGP